MRLRIAAIAIAVCSAAAIALPAVAQAAASPATVSAASVKAPPGARVTVVIHRPQAGDTGTCQYPFDGDTGWFICGTNFLQIHFVGGTVQVFGVGANHAIYTAWGSASGQLEHSWESMGGDASNTYCAWDDRSSNAVIEVTGPQGTDRWCRYRTGSTGSWGAWFQCDSWSPGSSAYSVMC